MIKGFRYKHYKGDIYVFSVIALSYNTALLSDAYRTGGTRLKVYSAHREGKVEIEVKVINGTMYIDSVYPHVIYQLEGTDNRKEYWARRVDDFFGYVPTLVNTSRFTLLN